VTEGMRSYLAGLSDSGRAKLRKDATRALRIAWPNRSTARGRVVVVSNVTMLRNLRAL
jgi:hypothetical protein